MSIYKTRHPFGAILVATACCLGAPALATTIGETKLTASDGASGDLFGFSVAIDGSTGIVGALFGDGNETNSGSAYLFDVTTGTQTAKLTASDGSSGDRFGESVAIDGNIAIVGAGDDDDNGSNSGSAYLYTLDATPSPVPLPAGAWFLIAWLAALAGLKSRARQA